MKDKDEVNYQQLKSISEAAGKRLLKIIESDEPIDTEAQMNAVSLLLKIVIDINYRFAFSDCRTFYEV